MTQFDGDFDYLQILEIDPADALRSLVSLAERIKLKKKEWTAQALNPLYAQAARSNLERARQFEALLAEPAALAAYVDLVKQSRVALRAEQESTVMGMITLAIGSRKELTAAQRELLLKEAKSEGLLPSLIDDVLRSRAIAVVAARKAEPAEQAKLPVQAPALDGVVFTEIQNWLKVLGKGSLYELLDLPTATPPPRLISQAQLLFAHWSKVLPKTNTSTAWEKTLQASLTYLKDAESKAKYDRSMFNQRIHRLVGRIDLVLAGSVFGTEEATSLVRLGVQQFGFSEAIVERCVTARMAALKVDGGPRAPVVVQLNGQVRCRRCGGWNGANQARCRECGSSLQRRCENPACRDAPVPIDAKACPDCGLPVQRGLKFRTLLGIADALLQAGSYHAAISVCEGAAQILPGPAVEERLARASRIRTLAVAAKAQAAASAWTAAAGTLRELLKLAPRLSLGGVPTPEKIGQYTSDVLEKVRSVAPDLPTIEAAKAYLGFLRRWSDCDEVFQRLRQICNRLEAERDPRRAALLVGKMLELRPGDPDLKAAESRLAPLAREAEAMQTRRRAALLEYETAVRESRLFAAEKILQELERLADVGQPPPGAEGLRARLIGIQRELAELRLAAPGPEVFARFVDVLGRCRDCREAMLALQNLPIAPPASPEGLAIRREGNRRVLSWRPAASGRQPSWYIVQRSITRPGSRQVDPPFQTAYEGSFPYFSDDEIAHGGVILRYMVQAVARGRIEVEGITVRTFDVASAPATFDGVLVSQEVMNLRSTRHDGSLELTWFTPTGVRQVLVERWPGGPDDRNDLGVVILPLSSEARLVDDAVGERMVYTYRVSCVYDGPDGEHKTPGVCLTDGLSGGLAARKAGNPQSPAA